MEELEAFILRAFFEAIKLTIEFVVLPLIKFVLMRPILWPIVAAGGWWTTTDHSFWPTFLVASVVSAVIGFVLVREHVIH
jgi:hypothetical protein